MTKPVRMKLSRAKGFNLLEAGRAINGRATVSVARPSRFGNPCRVGMFKGYDAADAVRDFRRWVARDPLVRSYEIAYGTPPGTDTIRDALRGRNLACYCALDQPCHADVLLEIANA